MFVQRGMTDERIERMWKQLSADAGVSLVRVTISEAVARPEGAWKLVPVEPSEAEVEAAYAFMFANPDGEIAIGGRVWSAKEIVRIILKASRAAAPAHRLSQMRSCGGCCRM